MKVAKSQCFKLIKQNYHFIASYTLQFPSSQCFESHVSWNNHIIPNAKGTKYPIPINSLHLHHVCLDIIKSTFCISPIVEFHWQKLTNDCTCPQNSFPTFGTSPNSPRFRNISSFEEMSPTQAQHNGSSKTHRRPKHWVNPIKLRENWSKTVEKSQEVAVITFTPVAPCYFWTSLILCLYNLVACYYPKQAKKGF